MRHLQRPHWENYTGIDIGRNIRSKIVEHNTRLLWRPEGTGGNIALLHESITRIYASLRLINSSRYTGRPPTLWRSMKIRMCRTRILPTLWEVGGGVNSSPDRRCSHIRWMHDQCTRRHACAGRRILYFTLKRDCPQIVILSKSDIFNPHPGFGKLCLFSLDFKNEKCLDSYFLPLI